MANMDMSKYILEITPYQIIGPGPFPMSETLREMGRTFLFSYENGVGLERIDDLDRVKRGGYLHHSCAGVFITDCPLPNVEEIFFFISPGHPKKTCCNRELDDGFGDWRALAFEEGADDKSDCLTLDHMGPSNNLIYNFRATNVPSWTKLFAQTAHVPAHPTDETRENLIAVLSGSPELLWGLVALNIGNDIGNLGAYVTFGDRGIKLAWSPGSQPDSLYSTTTQDRYSANTEITG
ncbi:hypothetical protein DFP73DRAFT_209770 [Morchella snyderi]|nr:hypothetical protein DFP73DRAFT_209770 [Morchella snyderi]